MQKIRVFHFNNGTGGGTFTVLKNLLQYSSNDTIENHIIYTINKDSTPEFVVTAITGAVTEQVFYYSPKWNFYYTCKQLSKLLPDDKALIIANDWLELGMISNLGLQNKVIQIVHGDYEYYYTLAKFHAAAIDIYIPVAASIRDKLQSILPDRKNDILYLRFPVPESICNDTTDKQANSIIFIGRCTEEKGYHLLPVIAKALVARQIDLQWHIVGELEDQGKYPWDSPVDVIFHGYLSSAAVNKLLCQMHLFILPSIAEGMPVSLIESMKAGVIPVVNNLSGGVQELVNNAVTGFCVDGNETGGFVEAIKIIVKDKAAAMLMSSKCKTVADELFNPDINSNYFDEMYQQTAVKQPAIKPCKKIYGSRLDNLYIPNWLVNSLRRYIIPIAKK